MCDHVPVLPMSSWIRSMARRLFASIHILLLVAGTLLQLQGATRMLTSPWIYTLLGLVMAASVITNLVSLIWTRCVMDFAERRAGEFVCFLLHLLQLGLVWRYIKVLIMDDPRDSRELGVLRVLQVLLQEAPYIIIQAYLMSSSHQWQLGPVLITVTAFVTIGYSFIFLNAIDPEIILCRMRQYLKVTLLILFHVFMLTSRFIALIVFTIKVTFLTPVVLAIHLLCYTVSIFAFLALDGHMGRMNFGAVCFKLFHCLCATINIPDIHHLDATVKAYFVVIFVENAVMSLVWFVSARQTHWDILLLIGVLTTYILGAGCAVMVTKLIGKQPCSNCDSVKLKNTDKKSRHRTTQSQMTRDMSMKSPGRESIRSTTVLITRQESDALRGSAGKPSVKNLPKKAGVIDEIEEPKSKSNLSLDIIEQQSMDAFDDALAAPDRGHRTPHKEETPSNFGDTRVKIDSSPESPNSSNMKTSHTSSDSGFMSRTLELASLDSLSECSLESSLRELQQHVASPAITSPSDEVFSPNKADGDQSGHAWDCTPDSLVDYLGEMSESGCYADLSTLDTGSSVISVPRPVHKTPDSRVFCTDASVNLYPALPARQAGPERVTGSSCSSRTSYEDTCTTCRDSYRQRRLARTPTSCTSDTIDDMEFWESDNDYMTWPPRKISIVNITDLPKEKINLQESISRWLNHLSENRHDDPPTDYEDFRSTPTFERSQSLTSFSQYRNPTKDYMSQFLIKTHRRRPPPKLPTKLLSRLCTATLPGNATRVSTGDSLSLPKSVEV